MKLLWKAKMSTIQEGGEEVEEGAVYNVTLKRVQIQQAANKGARWLGAGGDQLPPEHTVRQYETCKIRTIKAGTLEKLVENLLTAFGDNDFTYISIFLSTYRAFASTKVVLELLLDRYGNLDALSYGDESRNSTKSRMVVKSAITSIVRAWIDQCSEDFRELPDFPCLLKLLDYLKTNMPGSDTEKRAQNLLEQFQNQEAENDNAFNNIFPFNLSNKEELEITPDEFSFFQEDFVAEQLTYMDAELFKKVVPYHCLGSIWSRRDRKENEHLVPTIRATISQFNAVTNCVVSTILINKELKIQQRAKIVEKWIHIAHECRILKNFSSLRAIISALQSSSIYQLKKTWACIPKDAMQIFEELSDIFSDHYNYLTSREILMKEGTSKFANLDGSVKENQKRTQRRLQLQKDMGVIQGTVPYLGTFLTDLVMLDTAIQDHIEGGLINFEKRRKEFEIIAQIKLLQSACNSYCMTPDQKFIQWFRRQHHLTEEESYSLSREVETAADTSTISPKSQNSMVKRLSLLFLGSEVATQSTPIKGQSKSTPSGSAGESTNSASVLTCKAMIHSPPVKEEPKSTPSEKVGESTDSSCKVMTQSSTIKKQPKSTPSGSAGESTNSASVLTCKAMIHSPPVEEEPKSTPSGSAGKTTNSASVLTCKAMIHSPPVKEEPKSTPSGSAGESTNSASVLTCKAMIHSPPIKEEPKSTPSGKVGESTDSSCKVMTQSSTIKKQPKSTPSGSAGKSTNSASVSSCQVMTQSTPIKEEPKSTPSGSTGKSTNSARVLTCKAMIHSPPIKEESKSTPSGSAGESTNSASVLTCKAMIHSPPVKEEPKSTPSGSAGESTDSSYKVMTQSTTIKKQPKSTPSGSTGESTNSAHVLTCKAMIHSPPIKEEPKSTPSGSAGESTKSASVLSPELNHLESGDVCISPVGTPDKFQIKTSESSSSFTISIGTSSSLPSVVSTPSILNSSSSDLDSVSVTPKTSKMPPLLNSAQCPEVRVIRVSVKNNKGNVYKSILITNQERTPAVIEKAMLKHDLHFGTADDYELVQIISEDKELVLPHNTNVYYSMNSRVKFNFILREKQQVRRKVKQKHSFFPSFPRKRRGWGNSHRPFAL